MTLRRPQTRRILYLILMILMLTGCTSVSAATPATPSVVPPVADVAQLIALSDQATQLARQQQSDARLLQIDTDLTQTSFRFSDSTGTREFSILVPVQSAPLDQWTIRVNPVPKPAPGFDVTKLRVGPQQVAEDMLAHWPTCKNVYLYLFGNGVVLEWTASCRLPEGVVNARVDNGTGVFEALSGPVRPPATALP